MTLSKNNIDLFLYKNKSYSTIIKDIKEDKKEII